MEKLELKRKTNREIVDFINLLARCTPAKDSLLDAARKKTLKNARAFIETHSEKIETIKRDHCITDPATKAIIRDANKEYMFTVQSEVEYKNAIKKFQKEPCVELFEICQTFDTTGLSAIEIEELKDFGFLLTEEEYKARYRSEPVITKAANAE